MGLSCADDIRTGRTTEITALSAPYRACIALPDREIPSIPLQHKIGACGAFCGVLLPCCHVPTFEIMWFEFRSFLSKTAKLTTLYFCDTVLGSPLVRGQAQNGLSGGKIPFGIRQQRNHGHFVLRFPRLSQFRQWCRLLLAGSPPNGGHVQGLWDAY